MRFGVHEWDPSRVCTAAAVELPSLVYAVGELRDLPTLGMCPRETVGMAYDVELADRIRQVVQAEPGVTEQRMFGGLAFLIQGNMAVSASGQGGLMLRVDPMQSASLISEPHVQRVEMRGRLMDGWLRVSPEALEGEDDLRRWVGHGVRYAPSGCAPSSRPGGPWCRRVRKLRRTFRATNPSYACGMQVLIVDGANVVGSRPDGWWRDRAGAARRLHDQLSVASLPQDEVVLVLEGEAKRGQCGWNRADAYGPSTRGGRGTTRSSMR